MCENLKNQFQEAGVPVHVSLCILAENIPSKKKGSAEEKSFSLCEWQHY